MRTPKPDPTDSYSTREAFDDLCRAVCWRYEDGKRYACDLPVAHRLGDLVGYCWIHWQEIDGAFRMEQAFREPLHPDDVERRLARQRAHRLQLAEVALARNRAAGASPAGHVYFIQAGEEGPIKIGTSRNPRARFIELQVASPYPLLLRAVIPGGTDVEAVYHARFALHRLSGEWFEPDPALLDVIAGLASVDA